MLSTPVFAPQSQDVRMIQQQLLVAFNVYVVWQNENVVLRCVLSVFKFRFHKLHIFEVTGLSQILHRRYWTTKKFVLIVTCMYWGLDIFV